MRVYRPSMYRWRCTEQVSRACKRRMERHLPTATASRVYDDFAHHPTAIRTTLEGLRNAVVGQRRDPGGGGTTYAYDERSAYAAERISRPVAHAADQRHLVPRLRTSEWDLLDDRQGLVWSPRLSTTTTTQTLVDTHTQTGSRAKPSALPCRHHEQWRISAASTRGCLSV